MKKRLMQEHELQDIPLTFELHRVNEQNQAIVSIFFIHFRFNKKLRE